MFALLLIVLSDILKWVIVLYNYKGNSFIVFRASVFEWNTVSLHIREVLLGFLRRASSQTWMDEDSKDREPIRYCTIKTCQTTTSNRPSMVGCLLVIFTTTQGFITNLCSILFSKIWCWAGCPSKHWIQGCCRRTAQFSCKMPKEREIKQVRIILCLLTVSFKMVKIYKISITVIMNIIKEKLGFLLNGKTVDENGQ